MTQQAAEKFARSTWGNTVTSVTKYTSHDWRDGGFKGFRVTLNGDTIHWLTPRGRHQEEVCCPKQRARRVESKPVVVRR